MTTVSSVFSGFSLQSSFVALVLTTAMAVCILGGLLRLMLGTDSALLHALSACTYLAFAYFTVITLWKALPESSDYLQLPFTVYSAGTIHLPDLTALAPETLYPELLRLFLLAFLSNLLQDLIPKGKNFLQWLIFRLIILCGSLGIYIGLCVLAEHYTPWLFGPFAQHILFGLWGSILVLGLYKILVWLTAGTINSLLAFLFDFLFSNIAGKQLARSIVSCALMVTGFSLLLHEGYCELVTTSLSLLQYAPFGLIAMAVLFLFSCFT